MRRNGYRRIPMLLTALGFILLLAGYGMYAVEAIISPPHTNSLSLGQAPWTTDSHLEYRVEDYIGRYLGRLTYSFEREGNHWIVKNDYETPRLEEHGVAVLDANTLKPVSQEKAVTTPQGQMQLVSNYVNGHLEVKTLISRSDTNTSKQEPTTVSISLPSDAYDNGQLPMSLRALPFQEGFSAQFTNVVPAGAEKATASVTVIGKESVEIPAGTFESWRVRLDFGQTQHTLWYQVDSPHHLLKYSNSESMFVLTSFAT